MESDDMNAISMNAETQTASLRTAKTFGVIELEIPHRAPPSWLPVPASPRARKARQNPAGKTRAWLMPARRESRLEKLFLLLLVTAAVIGIGYGFSCLVDLVQNWALFGAGVDRLIQ
jgi:hypothetical protein